MVDFNPIRDLRSPDVDPFNVPAGQSTQEVEDIRLRLVLTREKTENVVKVIKNKGLIFKKDIEKIQELQRRLRRTIPRIPILRGDASTQVGSQVGVQKRGGFGLDFNRFNRMKTTVTKETPFPLLEIIVAGILIKLGIKGGTPGGANKITKFFRNNTKIKSKDLIKILEKEFARTKNPAYEKILKQLKLSEATKLKVSSQKEGFAFSSKKFSNIKDVETTLFPKGRTLTLTRRNSNRLLRDLRKSAKGNNGLGAENFDEVAASTDLVLKEMKNGLLTKIGKLTPGSKEFNQTKRAIEKIDDTLIKVNDIRTDVIKIRGETTIGGSLAEKDVKKEIKIDETSVDTFMQNLKNMRRKINKKNFKQEEIKFEKPISFNNDFKSSNDIAMLNTDTSYRDIYVIKVDPNSNIG